MHWSHSDVGQWLVTCNLKNFVQAFRRGGINGSKLLRHDAHSLRRLLGSGIAEEDAFPRLCKEIADLRSSSISGSDERLVIKLTDLELSQTAEGVSLGPGSSPTAGNSPVVDGMTVNWSSPEVIQGQFL